jgi:hypothetical protein
MSHGPSKDAVLVVPDEVVVDVSSDQTLLASYASAALAGPGPLGGKLRVRPLPMGDPIFEAIDVDGGPVQAFGATFGLRGTTLLYFTRATAGIDAGPQPVDFGQPWLWSPALGSPAPLAAGLVTLWTATPDHSIILFVESTKPVLGPVSSVGETLRLLSTADCAAGSCPTTPLVDIPAVSGPPVPTPRIVRIAIAPDGLHVAYQEETANTDGTRIEAITLVSTADQSKIPVSSTRVPAAITYLGELFSFSPDGSLLATVEDRGNGPLQLKVASTATGAGVGWQPQPADLLCTQVGFSDSQTVFVAAVANEQVATIGNNQPNPQIDPQIWRTTADSSTRFADPGSAFTVSHTYPGTERYLAYTTAPGAVILAGQPHDLLLADLATPGAVFSLGVVGSGTLTFSQDVSSAFTYEGFQPFTQTGTLIQVPLPPHGDAGTTVDINVYTGSASFARGSSKILYFANPDTRTSSGQSLIEWDGTGTQLEGFALNYVSADNPPTLYFTLADPRAIYRQPLP